MTLIEALRLAVEHHRAGRHREAVEVCEAVLRAVPGQPETLQLIAVFLMADNRAERAEAYFRKAQAVKPDATDALVNYGVLTQNQARLTEAAKLLDHALRLNPRQLEGWINRGGVWLAQGDRVRAFEHYAHAAGLAPLTAGPLVAAGNVLRDMGHLTRSVAALRRATVLEPGAADAWMQLGHALRESGGLTEAAAAYGRSYALEPRRTEGLSYRLFSMQAVCDWRNYDRLCAEVRDVIDRDAGLTLPLAVLAIDTTPAQQLAAARRFYKSAVVPRPTISPAAGRRTRGAADGRLTVAYFSADFHEHATAYLAAEMFELHDRSRYRVLAFSFGQDDKSPMRRRLIDAFETFHDIRSAGMQQVRELTAREGVDIAVDLKGYTKQSRLDVLSERLAPLHVSYLGFPGTLGSDTMDYIVGDRFVTPMDAESRFSEKLAIMPDSYQINDRMRPLDGRTLSRKEYGLPEDGFVFCAFNTTYKLNPQMFDVWMRLLRRTPGSVLWMFEAQPEAKEHLLREAASRGVPASRIVFAPKLPLADHLARYRAADLGVDSFPYTGHTTTSDALWIGMPVVTLRGDTFASQVAAGLLSAAGLPDTITTSLREYEESAAVLAQDRLRLASYRRRLEENRLTSPLFDSLRFTRHLERAYDEMWKRHAAGLPPQSFNVPPLPPGAVS
jgi:protein O-GlcNAc transferase